MAVKKAKQAKSETQQNVAVKLSVKKVKGSVKGTTNKNKASIKTSNKEKTLIKSKNKAKKQIYREKQTRIEILQTLAEKTNFTKTQIEKVFDELNSLMLGHLGKKGSGEFTIPKTGVKLLRIKKKASKARTMVSPLTGQKVTIAAKPARHAIKVTPLKVLKEMVER